MSDITTHRADDNAEQDKAHGTSQDPDVATLLRRVIEIVSNAKSMPLSASVLISRDEVLEFLDSCLERLPDELRQARWMLREREEYLEKTHREAERILESARAQAERMVQRTEIARQAEHNAERMLESAREEASRLRNEAEDYCDQKLAAFEIVLERTAKLVQAGREKLQGTPSRDNGMRPAAASASVASEAGSEPEEAFFDQDKT